MSAIQNIFMLGLVTVSIGCNPPAQIVAPGTLGSPVSVSGDLQVLLEQPDNESKDVYAVVFAALETSSVVFCKNTSAADCNAAKSIEMTFQRREENGFYFISSSPLAYSDGTELLFLGYISNNGGKASQTGNATYYKGTISTADALSSDNLSSDSVPIVTPSSPSGGIDSNVLGDLFKQLLGGATTTPTQPVTPVPVPANPQPPVAGTTQTDNLVPNPNNIALSASEFEVIRLTNAKRQEQGKAALIVQNSIMVTARESSRLMKAQNNMVHGLTSGWNGENIANGYPTPGQVVTGWINSPGHYRNMMGSFRYIGVGDTVGQNGGVYWTQQFNN